MAWGRARPPAISASAAAIRGRPFRQGPHWPGAFQREVADDARGLHQAAAVGRERDDDAGADPGLRLGQGAVVQGQRAGLARR